MPLACDLGNPKPLNLGSFKHNPKQTETKFQICFSNVFQLGILASELQGSRSSSVVLSSKPLVISPKHLVAELCTAFVKALMCAWYTLMTT